jgi:hypothetical protein
MRRILITSLLAVAGGSVTAAPALATSPPDTPPPATEAPADTGATAEITPSDSQPVVVVDVSGSPVAAITVVSTEPAWTGFGEGDEPQSGHEYLRVTVAVESRSPRGLFPVDSDDFILQDVDGFVTTASIVPTAEQAASETEVVTEAELAEGETVELPLTFEVVSGVAPQAIFYQPSSDRLITVTELD